MTTPPVPPADGPVGAQPELPACVRHPDRPTGLRCARCERPACPECLREAPVGYQCVDCVNQARRTVRRPVTVAGAELVSKPVVTPVLIAINVVIFAITAVQAKSVFDLRSSNLYVDWLLWPQRASAGSWWNLITSGFLHVNPIHLVLNMVALWVLGRDMELVLGRVRFVGLYVLALIGGGVSVYLFGAPDVPVVGASGAIFGLMGGLLVALVRLRLDPKSAIGVIAMNLIISVSLPGISLLGHLGGLVVGAAATAGLVYAPPARRTPLQIATMVALLAVLVVLIVVRTSQLGCQDVGVGIYCPRG
ncbi:rhomboid family intramembrane serine protease [Solihabitans fulvus]|uniref:Rhomboid family intramembrane serine protease n=1 Tax=Solihabitans fulvus TaxID=1892852 RepID=A0A5B2XK63_9PSEU|nr:rhomboid family intramembrane serine protease [Solihabitans fulvus]KAA2263743.1 rhomboid family intramembrane serine protease [Solihabitans fulvus]